MATQQQNNQQHVLHFNGCFAGESQLTSFPSDFSSIQTQVRVCLALSCIPFSLRLWGFLNPG